MCGVMKANASLVRRHTAKSAEGAELRLVRIPAVPPILVEEDEGRQDNLVYDREEAKLIKGMVAKQGHSVTKFRLLRSDGNWYGVGRVRSSLPADMTGVRGVMHPPPIDLEQIARQFRRMESTDQTPFA